MRRRTDFVGLIEAAYAPHARDEDWLTGLVAAAEQGCGCHDGVTAYTFDAGHAESFSPGVIAVSEGSPSCSITTMINNVANGVVPASGLYVAHPPALLLSEAIRSWGDRHRDYQRSALGAAGMADVFGIRGVNHDGSGVILCLIQERQRSFAPRTRGAFGRVARHMAAAFRPRRRLREHSAPAEAVLLPNGKLEHVEDSGDGLACKALPNAVRAMGRARGRMRRAEPERATELWTALVRGRWSVVESVESDGKRLLCPPQRNRCSRTARARTPRAPDSGPRRQRVQQQGDRLRARCRVELGQRGTRKGPLQARASLSRGAGTLVFAPALSRRSASPWCNGLNYSLWISVDRPP
jgi:hypothetical protein